MAVHGYSGTPLAKKLGFKNGFRIRVVNAPENYFSLFTGMPDGIDFATEKKLPKNLIHYFTKNATELHRDILLLKSEIVPNGMIWISWPKKSSKIESDVDEDLIRQLALRNGLVDIKVCAIDEIWSGLKLVIPVKDRPVGK
ncbi:DUF3052 family protein [soil metagenome]